MSYCVVYRGEEETAIKFSLKTFIKNKPRYYVDNSRTAKQQISICFRWCIGVIYFTNTTNRTDHLLSMDTPRNELPCKALNYSFVGYTRACLWWNNDPNTWVGDGCKVYTLSFKHHNHSEPHTMEMITITEGGLARIGILSPPSRVCSA